MSANGTPVRTVEDYVRIRRELSGRLASVEVFRDGQRVRVDLPAADSAISRDEVRDYLQANRAIMEVPPPDDAGEPS